MKIFNGARDRDEYWASAPEIMAILRYWLRTPRIKDNYILIHTDNPVRPEHYTGGVIYEGIKLDSLSIADWERSMESSVCVTMDNRPIHFKLSTIRNIGFSCCPLYWNTANPWVQDLQKRFPAGSEIYDSHLKKIIAEYMPATWEQPA